MKPAKTKLSIGAVAISLCLLPTLSWSSRALAPPITGTVTAAPSLGTIEIDHHIYRVKTNTSAAKNLSSFYVGESVDIIVDGPPNTANPEIISITQHQGS